MPAGTTQNSHRWKVLPPIEKHNIIQLAGLNHARALLYPIPQGGQYGGAPAHVQTITLNELQQFWKDYYKPNNAFLIIAGKFDPAEARKSIHRL